MMNFVLSLQQISNKQRHEQRFFKELTPVAIRDYYKSLSKKDKGNFLQFLVANCDLGYSTLINRLAGRSEFHRPEIIIISEIIEGELWKSRI